MNTAVPPRRAAVNPDIIVNEQAAHARANRLRKLIDIQAWIIGALTLALFLAVPFSQPVYTYFALNPDKQVMHMVGLTMPNMTNRAVLSWAVTSIVEIMTMGFGDMDVHLPQQRPRFTDQGWEAFRKAFIQQKIGQQFKQNQLVLTTVPTNTPVIVGQGVNSDNVYQWVVQMPVVMTYATNNNVTKKENGIVTLVIVRVPAEASSAGIAIQRWVVVGGKG